MLIFFITTISETLWFHLSSLSMNSIFVAWKSKIANKLKFAVKTAVPYSEDLTSNSYTLFQKPYNWNNDGFLLWISYIEELAYWEKSACNSNVLLVIFRTAVYSNLGLLFYISVFYTNYLLTEALLSYFSYFIFHELQIPYRFVNNTNGSKYSFGKLARPGVQIDSTHPFIVNSLQISFYKFCFIKGLHQRHIKKPVKHLWWSENDYFVKINYG